MDNYLSIDDRYVFVDDPDSQQRHAYQFDNLYLNHHEYMKSSYRHTVAPLVQQTIEGESTMVVFGGLQSLRANEFMLSNTVMQGVITPAAAYLLNAITSSNQVKVTDPHPQTTATAVGSVTFSWYKIQCSSPEVITDVLKTASTMTNSSSNSSMKDSNSLVLRELGKGGRGMIIPGLWEVEIANSGDIEAVVNHLQKIIPEVADHSSRGDAHTVMQLTINRTGQQTNPSSVSSHAATTVTDTPGLGRISFLLLSHLHSSSVSSSTRLFLS